MPKSSSAEKLRQELFDSLPSIPATQRDLILKTANHLADLDAEICALRLIARKVCRKMGISADDVAKEIAINPAAVPMIRDILAD